MVRQRIWRQSRPRPLADSLRGRSGLRRASLPALDLPRRPQACERELGPFPRINAGI